MWEYYKRNSIAMFYLESLFFLILLENCVCMGLSSDITIIPKSGENNVWGINEAIVNSIEAICRNDMFLIERILKECFLMAHSEYSSFSIFCHRSLILTKIYTLQMQCHPIFYLLYTEGNNGI